ncbi:MAG: energy transducer TonB [Pseudomonadota bacterium]
MGGVLRIVIGLPFAAATTFALFMLMQSLIRQGDIDLPDIERRDPIEVTRRIVEEPEPPKPTDPDPVEPDPPRVPQPPVDRINRPDGVVDTPQRPDPDGSKKRTPEISLECAPIVRVAPEYPTRCMGRAAATETVTVEFDIDETGAVTSAQVAASSNSCFDRAALQAVSRWKYSPAKDDAKQCAYRTQFTFELPE